MQLNGRTQSNREQTFSGEWSTTDTPTLARLFFFALWTAVIYRSRFVGALRPTDVELSEQWWMAPARLNHIVRECNILLLSCSRNPSPACWRSSCGAIKGYRNISARTYTNTHTLPHVAHTVYKSKEPAVASPSVVTLHHGWLQLELSGASPSSKLPNISPAFSLSLSFILFLWCSSSISLCPLPI